MAAIRSHSLSIGIVGLPNSGKSTLFNALTHASVPAESYPFCTIDKNVGVIKIDDPYLDKLQGIFGSAESHPSAIRFVDIAGLVKGASKGEGLGNKFLGHIREVHAIMYVLRGFESEAVSHVFDRVHPVDDLKIVRSELILKDIETLERAQSELKTEGKVGMNEGISDKLVAIDVLLESLSNEIPAIAVSLSDEQRKYIDGLWLLTAKPAIYIINMKSGVDKEQVEKWAEELKEIVPENDREFIVPVDSKSEDEMYRLPEVEQKELRSMIDDCCGVDDIVKAAYRRLDLVTFYTGNEKEVHSWVIKKGGSAQDAAGVVHTELAENFVTADVVNVEKMIEAGGWAQAKDNGLVRNVGKEYEVVDGDCIHIQAH